MRCRINDLLLIKISIVRPSGLTGATRRAICAVSAGFAIERGESNAAEIESGCGGIGVDGGAGVDGADAGPGVTG